MSANTKIEWTDRTWQVSRGCSVLSAGCHNCYAMKFAHRFSGARTDRATNAPHKHGNDRAPKSKSAPYMGLTKQTKVGPQWTGVVRLVEDALLEPLRWRKPARVFVNSMSDLFHEAVPFEFVARVVDVIAQAKQHTFQVLTKRPERMRHFFAEIGGSEMLTPPVNLWLGVSVEDQATADARIPLLLDTPATVRFVSYEPALEAVDFQHHLDVTTTVECCGNDACEFCAGTGEAEKRSLHWIIVGGESGPRSRPFNVEWARSVVMQCNYAGVAAFVKQLGSRPFDSSIDPISVDYTTHCVEMASGRVVPRLNDSKGGDPAEWPESLRVREFPR